MEPAPARLDVLKTPKLFVNGCFVRTESGRYRKMETPEGQFHANVPLASRKDLRDAVRAARKVQPGWFGSSAFLRSQILYRAAEMLESRSASLTGELERSGSGPDEARNEVEASIGRLVYYAGWCDKLESVFGSPNPVAGALENQTRLEPTGVVAALAPETPRLLAPVTLASATILTGNAVVLVLPPNSAPPSLSLGEVFATSDLPAGIVNLLTGDPAELAPVLASHMDVNALIDATGDPEIASLTRAGSAANLKRTANWELDSRDWFESTAATPYRCLDATEYKTIWQTSGV